MRCIEAIREFKTYLTLEKGRSENTVISYIDDLTQLIDYLHKEMIEEITQEDISSYLAYGHDHYSASSMQRKMVAFRQFSKYLMREGIMTTNLMEAFDLPKQSEKLPETVSLQEVAQVLASITGDEPVDHRDACMIALLINSGLRVSEMVHLKVSDVNFHARTLDVIGKGDKERIIPLDEITLKQIKNYLYNDRPELNKEGSLLLFVGKYGKPISRENFYRILNNRAQASGVKTHFTPHKLRHTFATTLLEENADLRSIQELLGHSDISTTTIYTHVNHAKIKKDYTKYHPGSKRRT